jgi:hypothetical protein
LSITVQGSPQQLRAIDSKISATALDARRVSSSKTRVCLMIEQPRSRATNRSCGHPYIQKDSPGEAKEANWLPAPNDTIYLVMRLYWPKTTPLSILPAGEGTWQPPGVKQGS